MINNLTTKMSISKASVINNQSTVYFYNKKNAVSFGPGWSEGVYRILTAFFIQLGCLISKPVYNINANSVKISVVVYISRNKEEINKESYAQNNSIDLSEEAKVIDSVLTVAPKLAVHKSNLNKNNHNSKKLKQSFTLLEKEKMKTVVVLLSRYLGTNVELDIVRIRYPYYDSNILAQFIGINGKFLSFARIKKVLFKNAIIKNKVIPEVNKSAFALVSGQNAALETKNSDLTSSTTLNPSIKELRPSASILTGIKFRVSGRLAKQRVVPKRTVRKAYKGGVSVSKLNLVTSSTYTGKNKKGAFSIRVWLGHGIKNELK